MARLITSGAEFNDPGLGLDGIGGIGGSGTPASGVGVTITSSPVHTGGFAWQCASGAGNAARIISGSFGTPSTGTVYVRAYFNFTNLPGTTVKIISDNASNLFSCKLTTAGNLQLWNDTGTPAQIGSDSTLALTTGTWYRIELAATNASNVVTGLELRVATGDGAAATVASATGLSISGPAGPNTFGWIQAPGANLTCTLDDVAINDNSGANQNTWLGPGGIALLLPTGDNARGSLWLNGAGTTTALWDAVNNLPPIGKLTASKTALTQIEHTGGTAQSYDATMTTYTAAGVPFYSVINFVQAIVAHGEDIATGTKVLTHSIVSNPAVASAGNYNAGGDVGACGTYPTNWAIAIGTLTYAPTVTVGTAPVMRATRPSTDTRTADLCFMGILVDFSRLPVRPSMNESQSGITLNQAPMRAATW